MTPIRLGVVGLGLGQWIVETAKKIEGAHVVAAAENMPARLGGVGGYRAYEKENDLRLYEDADQMMDAESLDAIALAVTPKHRRALIESAGNRGIPLTRWHFYWASPNLYSHLGDLSEVAQCRMRLQQSLSLNLGPLLR